MISTVMNYKGREPPVTCQKFGSGVAHTLISRQEVYGTKWNVNGAKLNVNGTKWNVNGAKLNVNGAKWS